MSTETKILPKVKYTEIMINFGIVMVLLTFFSLYHFWISMQNNVISRPLCDVCHTDFFQSHSEELPHKAKDGSAADSIQGDTAAQMQATAQEKAIQVAKQKRVQEEEDRKLAEKLVLEEARDIMATNA